MMETPDTRGAGRRSPTADTPTMSRGVQLGLVGVIVLAFLGFFVGTQQDAWLADRIPPTILPSEPPEDDVTPFLDRGVIPAMRYAEVDRRQFGINRDWVSSLASVPELSRIFDPAAFESEASAYRDDTTRQVALTERAHRRAFEGAPPIVPHPTDQMTTSSCLACHAQGRKIGKGVVAPAMSHGMLTNCTQCHVEQHSSEWREDVAGENSFEGYRSYGKGVRAWAGAPPTVPHTLLMRENCLSCHGPEGSEPLRTSHPFRANCLQCHAPSADWDPTFRESSLKESSRASARRVVTAWRTEGNVDGE